jgi:hypothetical protein
MIKSTKDQRCALGCSCSCTTVKAKQKLINPNSEGFLQCNLGKGLLSLICELAQLAFKQVGCTNGQSGCHNRQELSGIAHSLSLGSTHNALNAVEGNGWRISNWSHVSTM